MIQELSDKYQKVTAALLFTICFNGMILPTYALGKHKNYFLAGPTHLNINFFNKKHGNSKISFVNPTKNEYQKDIAFESLKANTNFNKNKTPDIGGPSQPEMSSFKSVGTNDMVNLFTGDFSYNIPLLDVGGYPVNIFYDGGVGMEQEASWVGLGWNINPGSVNRNMRGVPDDFDGDEQLRQAQTMKPNRTWGVNLGADLELIGIKDNPFSGSVGATLGLSFNNYLGPALDFAVRGSTQLSIGGNTLAEKYAPQLGGSLSVNTSSRTGVTFSPAISLTSKSFKINNDSKGGFGLRVSTSYNSRSGIKALQISEQMDFNRQSVEERPGKVDRIVKDGISANLISTSISFSKPSYIPTMRMRLTNSAFSGHFQLGGGIWGGYASAEAEVYKQVSEVDKADVVQKKPMVGYLYMQYAANNANAVMDFTRVNDNEVTPSTPIISAPQYAYDVFTIQGEGTGGSIRAYRNDEGYVRDNYTTSKDKSTGLGADVGIPGHYGANFNIIKTPSTIGEWNAGNKLRSATGYVGPSKSFENVYFRNPGETSVLNPGQFDRIGGADLVRYKLGGTETSPTIEPVLEKFSKSGESVGEVNIPGTVKDEGRKKRSQVINFLTADEASKIGLDPTINSYDRVNILDAQKNLYYHPLPRVDGVRLGHHISQINVTETNGQRYIYGIPVYNLKQQDFTFSVSNTESSTDPDKVDFESNLASKASLLLSAEDKDGYFEETETPAYAQSFLLTGLLSPDYVDVTNNGITEDDLGNAVKFNYTKMDGVSIWRTPLTANPQANFNAGRRSDPKDDKGMVSYGERESWYLHSIESKTMIAIFTIAPRHDSKGSNPNSTDLASDLAPNLSGINGSDNSAQSLDRIDLYSKADLKKNGISGAKPIKTVHFEYSYTLCNGTPNNTATPKEGKLTLEKIYFTFNGQSRVSKNQYVFSYGNTGDVADNPAYAFNASDRWGTYKPASANPETANNADYPHDNLKNSDYPYGMQSDYPTSIETQEIAKKTAIDQNAGAWMLKKILLPSGGQMEVTYESDDYAFVQNKRAADMMHVLGFGTNSSAITNQLYTINGIDIAENNYAFIQVPEACTSTTDPSGEVFQKYLTGIEQLSFKLAVKMPGGHEEFLNSYATFDVKNDGSNYGLYGDDATHKTIWIKLNLVDSKSPLSLTAIEFLREQLPGQAYPGYDISNDAGLKQVGEMFKGWWDGIKSAFSDPVNYLRGQGNKAQFADVSKCFVRLNDPDGFKYGGGYRVKSLRLKDNWKPMNGGRLYTSEYGQDYDYKTTEIFNGTKRPISSGVASYEPSLGGDENPFQTMVQVSNKVPLGPASYGAIEMPILDAFFPAASVGYSKVTVTSIKKGPQDPLIKSRSGIGKQVTEFYTAKDFPVYYSNTPLDPGSDKQAKSSSFGLFFYKYAFDSRALSQGFLVETNDMHGKMKSQASYPENDDKTAVNYTQYFYRNTGGNGLDEKFDDFAYASPGGNISQGNMGIDIELMTDTREFSVKSKSSEIQGQLDLFPVFGFAPWLPFIWPVLGESENTYRAVTATKVISYHSVLDNVIVIDKGSQVSTKNLVYDAETGDVIVNQTNNEFNQPIYSTNYPAWWAYSGMGPAYKNIDAIYTGVNFSDGKILNIPNQNEIFESGDELYLTAGSGASTCVPESAGAIQLWAFDKNKKTTSLTDEAKDLVFMDQVGKLYTKNGVTLKIVRSGKRNMLSASAGSAVSMNSPIINNKLAIDNSSEVVNAAAVEFREKWQTDNDVFKRYNDVYNANDCSVNPTEDCNGYLEKSINPYVKGLLGAFRTQQSKVFYDNRNETNPIPTTNIAANGYLDNFKLYWDFNTSDNLIPDLANGSKWAFQSQVTRINSKGLELETKNALDIYTAAQYGFNKTMPVAITNNSPYNDMFAEGFEDNDYNERLNISSNNNCEKKHIDFSGLDNSSIVNTINLGFKAHSGNNVLVINPTTNGNSLKSFNISQSDNEDFSLIFENANRETDILQPGSYFNGSTIYPTISFQRLDFSGTGEFDFSYNSTFSGNHQFNINSNPTGSCYTYSNKLFVDGVEAPSSGGIIQIFLCTGYHSFEFQFNGYCPNQNLPGRIIISLDECINNVCSTLGSNNEIFYATDQVNCPYTLPIPAVTEMQNPIFSPSAGKKMLFTAWVHENCGNGSGPCTLQTFTNSSININFSDGSSIPAPFLPVGPIIDGWQKIEGDFTIPLGVTTMNMSFINNGSQLIYFDDIRIHPFNANMKSYVYDPVNLRLVAELDANNYATFYEYDDEGTLIRTKAETKDGIKTITETRSAKQKNILTIQE